MSRIRGRDTLPERLLRKALRTSGVRYRTYPKLPGRPDLTIGNSHLAIFVHGCFWHRCPRHFVLPATRTEFWRAKLEANVQRDRRAIRALRELGWRSLVVWECEVEANPLAAAMRVLRAGGLPVRLEPPRPQLGRIVAVKHSRSG